MPKAAHSKSDSVWAPSGRFEYSRVERLNFERGR